VNIYRLRGNLIATSPVALSMTVYYVYENLEQFRGGRFCPAAPIVFVEMTVEHTGHVLGATAFAAPIVHYRVPPRTVSGGVAFGKKGELLVAAALELGGRLRQQADRNSTARGIAIKTTGKMYDGAKDCESRAMHN
jgi:hypothetical protein